MTLQTVVYGRARMQNIGKLVSEFLKYVHHRHSQHTFVSYERVLRRLLDFTSVDYANLCPELLEGFLQSLRLGTNSLNTSITCLKSFGRYCEEFHGLPNIAIKLKYLRRVPWKQRVLSEEELQKVLAVAKPNIKAVLLFLSNTGLRIGELRSLKEGSVSPDKRLLYITGKGGKARNVPLNKTALGYLPTVLKFSKSNHSYYNIFCRLARRVGIEKFGGHALRHLYASRMAKHCNLYLLSKSLGHKSITTTESIYLHITGTDLCGLSDCLDRPAETG